MQKKQIAITLGIMCFILSMAIVIQLNTIQDATKTVGQALSDNELKDEVLKWKERYDSTYEELERAQNNLEEKRQVASQNNESSSKAKEELKLTNALLGLTELKGPGIIVTLKDNQIIGQEGIGSTIDKNIYLIHDGHLRTVINELKNAGAEAICINNERIVATTAINCDGNVVMVNGEKLGTPFVIKAIGFPESLDTAVMRPGGFLENLSNDYGIGVTVERKEEIIIPKYTKIINFKTIRNVK